MVDNLSILIAHAVLIYIAVRALMLDSQLPWFSSDEDNKDRESDEGGLKPTRRRARF